MGFAAQAVEPHLLIELEGVGECLVEKLELQFPFREIARLNGRPEIASMEVRIGAIDFYGFIP